MEDLYKEEVKELTELFRSEWKDVQKIATENGLTIDNTYLISFIEPDEGGEICLFYTTNNELYLYENENNLKSFKKVEIDEIKNEFPQVATLSDIADFENW